MPRSRVLLLLLLACAALYLGYQRLQPESGKTASAVAVPIDGTPMIDPATMLGAPDALDVSKWLRERTARYRAFLAKQQCDTLVLPLDVERSAFDRATRLLMAEDVARRLDGGGQCAVDPALLDLALGEGLRHHAPDAAKALARELKARRTVSLWAGHDASHHMRVTIRVSGEGAGESHSFDDLSYDSTNSPFDVFHRELGRMLQAVKLAATEPPHRPAGAPALQLPDSPLAASDSGDATPYERAARLTLLALLSPKRDSPAADRLSVRAYLVLAETEGDEAAVKRLRAHVLMQMQQRPYALAAIGGMHDAGSEALKALLDGNLPAARNAVAKVDSLWERVFLNLELLDLEQAYGRESAQSQTALLAALGPKWAALLRERRADVDVFTVPDPLALKQAVEQDFPLPGKALRDITQGSAIVGDASRADFLTLAFKHVREVQAAHAGEWCCRGLDAAPSAWDVLDMYDARAERSVALYAYHFTQPQGRPEATVQLLTELDADLAGHPYAETARALAEMHVLQREQRDRAAHEQRMHAAARIALVADPGQEWVAVESAYLLGQAEP